MGQVQDQHYQAAPDHPAGGSNHGAYPDLPPAPQSAFPPAAGRRSAGMVILVAGCGALAFAGLFLILPYLLANTGVAGFTVGFVASLIPLTAVLLAVFVIDPWEPEPKRLLLFAFTWGAVVSVAATLVIQPIFALAGAPPPGVDYSTFALTVQVILHSTWNSMATGRGHRQAILGEIIRPRCADEVIRGLHYRVGVYPSADPQRTECGGALA